MERNEDIWGRSTFRIEPKIVYSAAADEDTKKVLSTTYKDLYSIFFFEKLFRHNETSSILLLAIKFWIISLFC